MKIDDIRETLLFLDDWEERYRFVIDLGRKLPPLPEAEKTEGNKVRGCASQVWLVPERVDGPGGARLSWRGDSDAHIVKGLVAVVLALYSGKRPEEVLATDAKGFLDEVGLSAHLTAQRSNGLHSLVERVKSDARAVADVGA
jgi:cysteine desulfuration protein SufE